MVSCPGCGAQQPDESRLCSVCGSPLGGASPHAGKGTAAFAQTMLGVPAPNLRPRSAAAEAPTPPASAPRADLGRTVLGMPTPLAPSPVAAASRAAASSAAGSNAPDAERLPAVRPLARTLLGVAQPGIAPLASGGSRGPAPPPVDSVAPAPARSASVGAATALGHANTDPPPPGFDRSAKPDRPPGRSPEAEQTRPSGTPTRLHPAAQVQRGPAAAIRIPHARAGGLDPAERTVRRRTIGLFALALVGAGIIGGGLALLVPKPTRLDVTGFEVDAEGRDRIRLKCTGCGAGAKLRLGKVTTALEGNVATLSPPAPLEVGKNELEIEVLGAEGETDVVRIAVPVAFRVRSDLSGRTAPRPYAQVVVSVPEGASVKVGTAEVPVKAGVAIHQIDFSEAAFGEQPKTMPLAYDLPVLVKAPGLEKKTTARIQTSITPLVLDSPAPRHQLGGRSVTIRGRTLPFARLRITRAGVPAEVTADGKGMFGHVIEKPSPGPVEVMAFGENQVARRVAFELTPQAPIDLADTPFSGLTVGTRAAVRGSVVESRTGGGTTTALIDVKTGCEESPCLLSVVYGELLPWREGRAVRVVGTVRSSTPLSLLAEQAR